MVNVNVTISGILMCCDESICGLSLGHSYTIEKCSLDSLFFKDKITNSRKQLDADYYGSRIINEDNTSFICLKKEEQIQIAGPSFSATHRVITDNDLMCEEELSQYMDNEISYLNEKINLLRLFKSGNIGYRDIFFKYSFTVMDFIKNTVDHCIHNQTRNTLTNERFTLNGAEVVLCNQWVTDYSNAPYILLKDCIDEFSWGLDQIDEPTGFEQYTTALEMTLLPQNQSGKKQMLANRVSALLGNNPTEVQRIHQKILDYYRFRSESLHEGDGSNITSLKLKELEDITRAVLKKCLIRCKTEYCMNSFVTWDTVKNKIMNDLIDQVSALKSAGTLPA